MAKEGSAAAWPRASVAGALCGMAIAAGVATAATDDRLEVWTLRENTSVHATFQSHNTKVEAFGNGAVVSYLSRRGAEKINDYVVSYVDYASRSETVILSGSAATNAPCLARRSDDEIGVFVNDFTVKHLHFVSLRMDPSSLTGNVLQSTQIDVGTFGKYACAFDGENFQFIGNDGVLITIDGSGEVVRRVTPVSHTAGKQLSLQYPHLLYEDGILHLALTTSIHLDQPTRRLYWSILYLQSRDQGITWLDADGEPVTIPVSPDEDSVSITEPNSGFENRWLLNLDVIGGNVIAEYSDRTPVGGNEPVLQFWPVDGGEMMPAALPEAVEQRQTGVFVEDSERPDDIYFLTFEGRSMIVLKSADEGQAWDVWYRSPPLFTCPYGVDAARLLGPSRTIIGIVTERGERCGEEGALDNNASVEAFQLRVAE